MKRRYQWITWNKLIYIGCQQITTNLRYHVLLYCQNRKTKQGNCDLSDKCKWYYSGALMSAMASQITSISIVYLILCSGADQRKHQCSVYMAFVRGIHWWPMNSLPKRQVTIWWRNRGIMINCFWVRISDNRTTVILLKFVAKDQYIYFPDDLVHTQDTSESVSWN